MVAKVYRSDTANKRPDPALMAEGQLAINYESGSPGLFFKDTDGALVKVGPVHIGTTAPNSIPAFGGTEGNSKSEFWLDTSVTPNELKTWNGTAWVSTLPDEIPVTKLADGAARQLLQTDAAGTGVEWTDNIDVPGTLDVTGAATFDNNVTVQGDLTVNGTQVIINTETVEVEDKNIVLGKVDTPTDTTANGGGLTLKGATDKTLNWIDSTDSWTSSENVDLASGKSYRINGTEVLSATALGSAVQISSANIPSGTIVDDDVNASAAIAGTKISPDFGAQNTTTTGTSTAASFIPTSSTVPTNGVYLPAANSVALATNGTGRLFIDANGNIGTTATPGALLDLAANNTGLTSPLTARNRLRFTDTDSTQTNNQPTGTIEWYTSDTDSPGVHAYISTNMFNSGTGSLVVGTGSGGSATQKLYVNPGGTLGITADAAVPPLIASIGGSEVMRLDSSGRLGLGTSNPAPSIGNGATLHLYGASTTSELRLERGNGTDLSITAGSLAGGGSIILDNSFSISTDSNSSQALTINTSGNVGIGTTTPSSRLQTEGDILAGYLGLTKFVTLYPGDNVNTPAIGFGGGDLRFVGASERARIDSSGRLLVGTSTARSNIDAPTIGNTTPLNQLEAATNTWSSGLSIINNSSATFAPLLTIGSTNGTSVGSNTVVTNTQLLGLINFVGADGTDLVTAATIGAFVDGVPGAGDMPGRLVFSTTADGASSPTERMRISSDGTVWIGNTGIDNPGLFDTSANLKLYSNSSTTSGAVAVESQNNSTSLRYHFIFSNANGIVGSISTNASATAYTTSSDYRLKENVTPVTDGITRLQQLKPSRFNFIADPSTVVDGFIAHEVQAIVPEAITGEKDAVDDEGNPVYQGIDQSKLVPLLTAALQEAIGRIETLEAEVAALKAS